MAQEAPKRLDQAAQADAFIATWRDSEGGAERANYALFLTKLTDLLGVPNPDPAGATTETNDYVFERAVKFRDGGMGRIDLYKRGSFVLEAKQSRQKGQAKAIPGQEDLFTAEAEAGRMRGRAAATSVTSSRSMPTLPAKAATTLSSPTAKASASSWRICGARTSASGCG